MSWPHWSWEAWTSIAITTAFVGLTCWWVSVDSSVPIFDAGTHLVNALNVRDALRAGHLGGVFAPSIVYPPLVSIVGALGLLVGGGSVAAPIIAANLVFVPLLALGCYKVAQLAFGRPAGLLAVVFALGSPLLIEQFHVFMLDAPDTAMVAIAVWAIIETRGFRRVRVSALAGVVVGLGMLTKEPFALFVAGVIGVTVARGGWRAWRGLLVFGIIALAIALPWYIHDLTELRAIGGGTVGSANHKYLGGIVPPRVSKANFEWYFWSTLNYVLFAPLLVFAAAGSLWAAVGLVRRRSVSSLAPELLVGAFVGWVALTETYVHDVRYGMPLLVFLAVLGTGWIVRLRRKWRIAASLVLVLIALANVYSAGLGHGGTVVVSLPHATEESLQWPGEIKIYFDAGFLVAGPKHDGDLLATLQALHARGVRTVQWFAQQSLGSDFSTAGVVALSQMAGLSPRQATGLTFGLTARDAFLQHAQIVPGAAPPCVTLDNGTGVWIRLGNPADPASQDFCPSRNPQFYGP